MTGRWVTGGPEKHRCADLLHEEWRFKNTPSGIWRCDCGKSWRVFMGTCQWRVRRRSVTAATTASNPANVR